MGGDPRQIFLCPLHEALGPEAWDIVGDAGDTFVLSPPNPLPLSGSTQWLKDSATSRWYFIVGEKATGVNRTK